MGGGFGGALWVNDGSSGLMTPRVFQVCEDPSVDKDDMELHYSKATGQTRECPETYIHSPIHPDSEFELQSSPSSAGQRGRGRDERRDFLPSF